MASRRLLCRRPAAGTDKKGAPKSFRGALWRADQKLGVTAWR